MCCDKDSRGGEGVLVSTEGVTPMVVGLKDVNNGAGDRWFGIRDQGPQCN